MAGSSPGGNTGPPPPRQCTIALSRAQTAARHAVRAPRGSPRTPLRVSGSAAAAEADFRTRAPKDVRVLVVGPTGYIGKFVVKELVKRGYNVIAFAREQAGIKGKMGKEDIIKVRLSAAPESPHVPRVPASAQSLPRIPSRLDRR